MKFSAQFEFHKIPEWYSEYMDYKRLKAMIKRFKGKVSSNRNYFMMSLEGNMQKLRGLYTLT